MKFIRIFKQMFRRSKAATALNLVGLIIAFSSFIVIMAQVRYELTYDRQYKDHERIFRIESGIKPEPGRYVPLVNRPLGERMIASSADIVAGGVTSIPYPVSAYDLKKGEDTETGGHMMYRVSRPLLDVFGLEFIAGDTVRFKDPQGTVILSESAARSIFGNQDPIGQAIVVSGEKNHPGEVIAVYKDFPDNSSIARNSMFTNIFDESLADFSECSYTYFFKANDPGKIDKIASDIRQSIRASSMESEDLDLGTFRYTPVSRMHFTNDLNFDWVDKSNPATVYTLLTIAVLVLLIAMINFVNFATARLPTRIRYINTRKVMGESNGSIRRKLIGESVLIAFVSYLLALVLIQYLSTTSVASLVTAKFSIPDNLSVVLYTALASVAVGLLAGTYPAFYSTSFSPALILKGSFGLSAQGRRLRATLISFQYVISIILIIMALSVRAQNRFLRNHDMGFQRENILAVYVGAPIFNATDAFTQKLKQNPQIVDVTFANGPLVSPSRMNWGMQYRGKSISFDCYPVMPNFLKFFGIQIIEGRDFTAEDRLKETPSLIFNRTSQVRDSMVVGDQLWEGCQIVGIAEDFNFRPMQYGIGPFALMLPTTHSYTHKVMNYMLVKVNTSDMPGVIGYIKNSIREFDGRWTGDVNFLDEHIGRMYHKEDITAKQITLFGMLSVLISIVGVFGLVLFETQFRRKEIGLRKVYGATIGEILRMLNTGYVRIVLICFVIGAPVAYWLVHRWLADFAYKVSVGPWIFIVSLVIVLLITVVTITVQSYRTACENPVKSVKSE